VDGIRPEIQKALEEMNWEDRLEKARARRKAVLEGRASAEEGDRASDLPIVTSVDEVERLRFGTSADMTAPVAEAGVAARSGWMRLAYVVLGSCVGLAIAVGGIALGSQLLNREPIAGGQGPAAPPAQETESETATSQQPATRQEIAVPDAAIPRVAGPIVLTELGAEIASPVSMVPPIVPGTTSAANRAPSGLAGLGTPQRDAVPDVGQPPQQAARQMAEPGSTDAPALEETALPTMLSSLNSPQTGAGNAEAVVATRSPGSAPRTGDSLDAARRLPAIKDPLPLDGRISPSDPERPAPLMTVTAAPASITPEDGAGITGAFIADKDPADIGPVTLARAPAAGVIPRAESGPPGPVIPGAEDMSVFVFAATTTDDPVIGIARRAAEDLNLPVRAVSRVNYTISQANVRFYDAASGAAANRLATEIGAVSRDFTGSDLNPAPGTLEIYLAGEAAEAPPRPTARAAAPARQPRATEAERRRDSVLSRLRSGVPR